MAYSKEQLQQLQQQADKFWWFNSDAFKQEVNKRQWEWAYDQLRSQLEEQRANLNQTNQTQTQVEKQEVIETPAPTQTIQQREQTQDNIITNQMVDAWTLPETQRENIPQQPTQPVRTTEEVKATTDFWNITSVEQWKEQTGWWLNNLESWIENRYWTLAEKQWNKLIADVNWVTYEWELDQAGNPTKKSLGATWEIINDETKVINEFNTLLETNPTRDELNSFILKNKSYTEQFKPALKSYFKNKDTIEFYSQYSTYNPEELFTAYKEWKIIVWSDKYNSLPDELKQWFEEYKRLQEKTSDWISYTDMNNNVLSLNDYITQINSLFSSNLTEEYNAKVNSAEMTTLKNDMTSKAEEIADIDNTLKNLEDDLLERYPGITEWRLAALMRREQKALYRERDDLVVDYNSLQSSYSMQMDEIKYWIEMAKYEDSVNRANFETALTLYQTDRARMDEQQRYELEQQTALLAEQRQYAMQKELILFQEEINANKWWDYIDKWDGNLYYVKDWKTLATLEWLWTVTSSTSDDRYDYKIYEWENGTYTAFTIDKQTNKITQQTYDINWNLGGGYLSTLWNWQITSYGWIHDGWKWLDIDWSIWDPIYTPMAGRVIKVEDYGDKTFGKSIVVELEDGKKVRYSHLDQFNVSEWDKIWMGELIWTVWNTWYVIPWEGGDGSHIDIQIEWMNAYEVQDYLKWLWGKNDLNSNNLSLVDIAKFNNTTFKPQNIKTEEERKKYQLFLDEKTRVMNDKNASMEDILKYSSGAWSITDTAWKSLEKFSSALSQLWAIQEQISWMETWPVIGKLKNLNPYDTDAQTLKAQLTALIPNLARWVYWEVWVLTDNDVRLYSQTIPNLQSTQEVNNAILWMTLKVLAGWYKRQLQTLAASNKDVSGFTGLYNNLMGQVEAIELELWLSTNEVDNWTFTTSSWFSIDYSKLNNTINTSNQPYSTFFNQ